MKGLQVTRRLMEAGGVNEGAGGSDTMSGGCNSVLWTGERDNL